MADDACKIECNVALSQIWVLIMAICFHKLFLWWQLGVECAVHIWYSNSVLCIAHTCKISFGSVQNLSNYVHLFINFVSVVIEKNGILFIFGRVMNHNRGLMHLKYTLALCKNVALMPIIS